MRAKRAQTQALEGRQIIASGKRSAARGYGPKNDFLFFSFWFGAPGARQTRRKKRAWVGGFFTPGGGLGGLARGYYLTAPSGPLRGSRKANQPRQPTPGFRLFANRASAARRGCAGC